jgi:hypothetical protein
MAYLAMVADVLEGAVCDKQVMGVMNLLLASIPGRVQNPCGNKGNRLDYYMLRLCPSLTYPISNTDRDISLIFRCDFPSFCSEVDLSFRNAFIYGIHGQQKTNYERENDE